MPARHEYEGRECGRRYEWIVNHGEIVSDVMECQLCCNGCLADLSFDWGVSNLYAGAGEQAFGVRYFKNPETGHIIVAGTPYAAAPPGYRVETTTSYAGVKQLERAVNDQEMEVSRASREAFAYDDEQSRKALRRNMVGEHELVSLAAQQRELRREMYEEQVAALQAQGYSDFREYRPKIEDPNARARAAMDTERAYVDKLDREAKTYSPIDPGIHFRELHNDSKRKS